MWMKIDHQPVRFLKFISKLKNADLVFGKIEAKHNKDYEKAAYEICLRSNKWIM